jgi:transaldolase
MHELRDRFGQSPWLDNLKRGWITSGELQRWVDRGVRGITSNPTIFQKAIVDSADYDPQFTDLASSGKTVEESYWELVIADIRDALRILRPVHDLDPTDGFVSLELAPDLARDTEGSIAAARRLHDLIDEPNLYVKIPGTSEGVAAFRQMISEGRSINVTLLFSVARYDEVIEAYLTGLETLAETTDDLSSVVSVASFFVSRVDTETDRRLEAIGTPEALVLRGRTAVANAKLAYALFRMRFSGPRWEALASKGARYQRPLWASTSTKNPEYPDTMYVTPLIGDDTVNTMPEVTLEAFEDHGSLAHTVDKGFAHALDHMARLADVGVDLSDVTHTLEEEGVSSFTKSFDELLSSLAAKADDLRR